MPGERIGNSNQFLSISGVVSAPAYSWASDNNTGLYRIGADNIGVAANGAKVLDIATTGLTVTGAFASSNGISSTLTTDATSATTGSIITAGGISCQKAAVVGTLLGVGMAPTNVVDITKNQNNISTVSILNNDAGTAAQARFMATNGTSVGLFGTTGQNYTPAAIFSGGDTYVIAQGNNLDLVAAAAIKFAVNNNSTEIARFDTSGHLGIGGAPPAGVPLYVSSAGAYAYLNSTAGGYSSVSGFDNGTQRWSIGQSAFGGANGLQFFYGTTEGMRLDGSGNLLVGTTSNWASARSEFRGTTNVLSAYNTGTVGGAIVVRVDTDTASLIDFYRGSSTQAGKFISTGGGTPNIQWLANNQAYVIAGGSGGVTLASAATAWAAVSDETLKTDLTTIQSGAEKVGSLRAVTGRYKTDAESMSRSFLIAQDVQKVLPEAVSTDADGTLSLRYTEVIPLMVAAIQELTTRLAALEAK